LLTAPTTETRQAPPPCLTRAEVREITLAALPLGLDAAGEACRPSLPAGAFLLTGGRAMSDRLKTGGDAHWATAMPVLMRFAGSKDLPKGLQPDTLRALARDMLTSELKKSLKPADCGFVNELTETLAPLSEDGIVRLVTAGLLIAGHEEKGAKRSIPALCPAPSR
jgi:hypothetical protein